MSIVYKLLGALIVGLSWVGATWLGLMVVDRDPPVIYEGARALQAEAYQGGTIDVEFEVYRTKTCPVQIRRYLTDAQGVQHAVLATVGPNGIKGREVYQRAVTIPQNAAPGQADYYVVLEYRCNPLQELGWPIEVRSPRVPFRIIEAPYKVPLLLPGDLQRE